MGVEWRDGSLYIGPHGAVFWLRLQNRSANNVYSMYTTASVRELATRINNPDLIFPVPDPNPAWAPYGDLRVMAWNGGTADAP